MEKMKNSLLSILMVFGLALVLLGLWIITTRNGSDNIFEYELVEPAEILLANQDVEPENTEIWN